MSATTTVVATTPPTRPSIVFDGEMWVRNFVAAELLADEVARPCRTTRREDQQQDPAALGAEGGERRVGRDRPARPGRAG